MEEGARKTEDGIEQTPVYPHTMRGTRWAGFYSRHVAVCDWRGRAAGEDREDGSFYSPQENMERMAAGEDGEVAVCSRRAVLFSTTREHGEDGRGRAAGGLLHPGMGRRGREGEYDEQPRIR